MDIGAGSGKFTSVLVEKFPKSHIYAVEPVSNFIDILNTKFGSNKNVSIIQDEVSHLLSNSAFKRNSLDGIFGAQCFHWFATRSSLEVFHALLKPKGYLFLIWNRQTYDANNFLKELKSQIIPIYDDEEKLKSIKYTKLRPHILDLFAPNDLFSRVTNFITFKDAVVQRGKIDIVIDRVLSKSTFGVRSPQERNEITKNDSRFGH
ncbi:methyltransferase type 11 [Reticulomyxa filosa]|uniref:Methyltransferase type 11 n=1 Tax=Reticulomyxa filosa TaxID=46433 RepID=X6MVV6_RETFI|nr:methyltransferase type 11 [Reticulomyxa filosa]|eukprot:ETO17771.1 methyltransferase type 11 [Reticulomyxa filosa]